MRPALAGPCPASVDPGTLTLRLVVDWASLINEFCIFFSCRLTWAHLHEPFEILRAIRKSSPIHKHLLRLSCGNSRTSQLGSTEPMETRKQESIGGYYPTIHPLFMILLIGKTHSKNPADMKSAEFVFVGYCVCLFPPCFQLSPLQTEYSKGLRR